MDREIKFRGMGINGDWYFGNLSVIKHRVAVGVEPGTYISNATGMPFAYQVRPETVGQYIERKDINGEEIYEDSIVKVIMGLGETLVGVVVWDRDKAQFAVDVGSELWSIENIKHCRHAIEVIGNIHEHPELLEGDPR